MDRDMLREYLAQCRRHVAMGEAHIARQKDIIAELERDGHDSAKARDLLRVFEEAQDLHITHRDQLQKELGDKSE
jgi:hypothetical protein